MHGRVSGLGIDHLQTQICSYFDKLTYIVLHVSDSQFQVYHRMGAELTRSCLSEGIWIQRYRLNQDFQIS